MYFNSFKQKDILKVHQRNYFIDFSLKKKKHGFKIQEQYPINKVLSLCTCFRVWYKEELTNSNEWHK